MTHATVTIMAVCLGSLSAGFVASTDAATSFNGNGSTIIGIDEGQRTITFRTREGESWTLPVADPELVKKEGIAKGDQVSIEIDLNDQITRILKPSTQPSRHDTPEESTQ
jgi:hypothetical protein